MTGLEDEAYNQSFVGADETTDLRPVIMLPDNLVDCHRIIKHLTQESIRLEKEKNRMMKIINNMKSENRAIFTELIEENNSISKSEKKRLREKLRNIKKRIVGTPRKNKKRKFKDHP